MYFSLLQQFGFYVQKQHQQTKEKLILSGYSIVALSEEFELSSFLLSTKKKMEKLFNNNRKSSFLSTCNFQFMPSRELTKKEHKIDISSISIADDWKLISLCMENGKFCNVFACLEWWTENIHREQISFCADCWLPNARKMLLKTTTMGELFRFDFIYSSCYHSLRKNIQFSSLFLIF